MIEFLRQNPKYFIGAVLVHLFFLALFGLGFQFKSDNRASTSIPQPVKVTTIDERLVKKELMKLEQADQQEERRKNELVKKRKAEEKKLHELRQQRVTEQKIEKKRLALLKEKKLKEKKEQAKQRKQEQLQRETEFKQKMQAEQERLQKEQEIAAQREAELKKKQTVIDQYMNLIEAKVFQNWIKPPGNLKGKVSELRVRLIPSGDVISIELSKSSGDPVYDKSVQAAVKKASPLPLPPAETGLFDVFRDLHLPMRADKKT